MKREYTTPQLFADTFVANEYCATCKEPQYDIEPVTVKCITSGHNNTQTIMMFLDSQDACVAKFVPNVGSAKDDVFYTKFNACAYVDGCNKNNWLKAHPNDTGFTTHASQHRSRGSWISNGAFIDHDTKIDLSLAQKYNLS